MKAVIIGSYGHYSYIWNGMKKHSIDLTSVTEGVNFAGYSPKIYKTPDALISALDAGEITADIAVINTEFYLNSEYAAKCLERGIHVFLEKPAATELTKLDRLRELYFRELKKNPGLILCPMFGMRAEPHFITAKRLVAEGQIGAVRQIDARKSYKMGVRPEFYSDRKRYGGLIPWVAIHGIDLIRWMSGEEFTSVTAWHSIVGNRGNGDMEVSSISMFSMTGDIGAVVSADMLRPAAAPTHDDDRIRVVGTDGIVEVSARKVHLINSDGTKTFEAEAQDPAGDVFSRMIEDIERGGFDNQNIYDHASAEDMFYATEAALLARESADRRTAISFDKFRK